MRKGSTTMKQQRVTQGEAKAPLREIKLAKMRSGREKKAAELAWLTAVVRATTYSELKPMNNQDLADQLKHLKLVLSRDIKKTSLPNRKAYVIRIQTLLFTEFGVGVNNLEDGDDGYGGDGVRKRKASKKRGSGKLIKYLGLEWYANEEFEIDHLIDHMVVDGGIVPGRTDVAAGTVLYLVLWKRFPPEIATWEVSSRLRTAARASGLWACLLRPPPSCIYRTRLGSPSAASTSSAARRRPRRATRRRRKRRRGRRRRGRRRRTSPWTTRDAPARVHALRSRSSGRLQSSILRVFLEIRACCFWRMSLVCAVCALCAACIGVIRAHNIPGGAYISFFEKIPLGAPLEMYGAETLACIAIGDQNRPEAPGFFACSHPTAPKWSLICPHITHSKHSPYPPPASERATL